MQIIKLVILAYNKDVYDTDMNIFVLTATKPSEAFPCYEQSEGSYIRGEGYIYTSVLKDAPITFL